MCTIFMYMDALHIFTVDIASAMIALVNYQAMFTYSFCFVGKRRRTNRHLLSNNHIFHNHLVSSCCLRSHSSLVLFQRLWLQSQYWGCAFIVCSNSRVNKSVNSNRVLAGGVAQWFEPAVVVSSFDPCYVSIINQGVHLLAYFLRTDENRCFLV